MLEYIANNNKKLVTIILEIVNVLVKNRSRTTNNHLTFEFS